VPLSNFTLLFSELTTERYAPAFVKSSKFGPRTGTENGAHAVAFR
jgi:hypothetical protein